MSSNSFAIYTLLFGIYLVLFISIRLAHHRGEMLSGLHFGLLSFFALQGLASMIFGLTGIGLTLNNVNLALSIPILFMGLECYQDAQAIKAAIRDIHFDRRIVFTYLTCFLLATAAGLLFFTTALIPSSMTGDPARHFMQIINPTEISQAPTHKPIYYLWAGIFIHALPVLQHDQLFVLFNLFALGLSTSSCLLIFLKLFPTARWLLLFVAVILVNFGYSLFALHYGYYTLLLSSAYLFSTMALLLEYKDTQNEKSYLAVTLLAIGVVLTHGYLAPDALFILFGFDIWNMRRQGKKILPELARHLPFWILIVLVAYTSNRGLADVKSMERVIAARGFVNNDALLNLLPFLPFIGWYLAHHRQKESAQIILLFTAATTLFSLVMGVLYWSGLAAPYYLNRNQIILLPLLALAVIALLQEADGKYLVRSRWFCIFLSALIVGPYLLLRHPPLSQSDKTLFDLLDDESWVYFENQINTSYTPLQMTDRDRTLMRKIGAGQSACLTGIKDKVAVLGTDHEMIWFYLYTHIYPSLFPRDDEFMNVKNSLLNYKIWKSDPSLAYIVILSHFDFLYARHVVKQIRVSAHLVCQGDSIAIYRKPTP